MAKTGLLSPLRVGRETKPGRYGDDGGLYLQIKPSGSRSWLFRYKQDGKTRMFGLGAFPDVSLAGARKKAEALRGMLGNDVDPHRARDADKQRQLLEAARAITFKEGAKTYLQTHEGGWKNAKHRQQWHNTLETYVYPIIGALPMGAVDEPLVLKVLHQTVPPILHADGRVAKVGGLFWNARPDTARRVRGRIELILDWAKAHKYREGENPARWAGNLKHTLPGRKKRSRRHHPDLPYELVPAFLAKLRQNECASALALEFLIYNAPRTTETLHAKKPEIDAPGALWTIPEERMKAGVEHRIPLSRQSLAVLERAQKLQREPGYIFPGRKRGEPLSLSALLELVKPMGFADRKGQRITVHGFRSTFRDWVADCTSFSSEVADMALAHTIDDDVDAAYRRGDLFEKRRSLMQAWADYCNGIAGSNVLQFGARAAVA
jgi:integrase